MNHQKAIALAAAESLLGEPSEALIELAQRAIDAGVKPALIALAVESGRHHAALKRVREAKRAIDAARRALRREGGELR